MKKEIYEYLLHVKRDNFKSEIYSHEKYNHNGMRSERGLLWEKKIFSTIL